LQPQPSPILRLFFSFGINLGFVSDDISARNASCGLN